MPGAEAVFAVIPFNEQGQRLADGFCDNTGDHAHPPAVIVDVDTTVKVTRGNHIAIGVPPVIFTVTQRVLIKVVVVMDVRCRGPHERMPINNLAHAVQVAALLQV